MDSIRNREISQERYEGDGDRSNEPERQREERFLYNIPSGESSRSVNGDVLLPCWRGEEIAARKVEVNQFKSYVHISLSPTIFQRELAQTGEKYNSSVVNSFEIRTKLKWILHLYEVSFQPNIECLEIRKKFMSLHKLEVGGYLFDGYKLITPYKQGSTIFRSIRPPEASGPIKMFLKYIGVLEPKTPQFVKTGNTIIKAYLKIFGTNYFEHKRIHFKEWNLEMYTGHSVCFGYPEGKLLCIKNPVSETVYHRIQTLKSDFARNQDQILIEQLKGINVITHYNHKSYQIYDVDSKMSPLSTFPLKKCEQQIEISFLQHYKQKYLAVKISYADQPLLIAKSNANHRGKINKILIPELCYISGSPENMNHYWLMNRVSKEASQTSMPTHAYTAIATNTNLFLNRLSTCAEAVALVKKREMSLVPGMAKRKILPGTLPPNRILMLSKHLDESYTVDIEIAKWMPISEYRQMYTVIQLRSWAIIFQIKNADTVKSWLNVMELASARLNFQIQKPEMVPLDCGHNPGFYSEAIRKTVNKMKYCQLIFAVINSNKEAVYEAVKNTSKFEYGIPSLCFLARNFKEEELEPLAMEILIEINSKIGGSPWRPLTNPQILTQSN